MESSSIFGAEKMEPNDFENNERALVALRDDDAAAFCTFTNRDEMPREYGCGPLIGFLFVAEKYRGNRLSEQMVNAACNVAKEQGFSAIYLGKWGCMKNIALPKSEIIKRFTALLTSFFPKRCNKKCCSRERATAN